MNIFQHIQCQLPRIRNHGEECHPRLENTSYNIFEWVSDKPHWHATVDTNTYRGHLEYVVKYFNEKNSLVLIERLTESCKLKDAQLANFID